MSVVQARRPAERLAPYAAGAALGLAAGAAVALVGANALVLAAALAGCAFVLRDFRVGVVALIVLLPLSSSRFFPHAMLGVTGLNPFNLLLAATLGACLLHGLFDGSLRRFLPPPLAWLYLAPLVLAGALGARHVGEIAPGYYMFDSLSFHDAAGYLRDMLARPLLLVVFALLVAAAVARSARPQLFLLPALAAAWLMALMVVAFVGLSGAGLGELSSSTARGFLSELGLHANELGRLFVVAYALMLFTWSSARRLGWRLALLASMALTVAALVLTFSRGAFLGFFVVNALFLLWQRSAKTILLACLLAAVAALLLPDAVYDRAAAGFGGGLNAVSAGRIDGLWLPLVPDLLRSPLFGNGLGSILWSEAMRRADGVTVLATTHPHNAYLEALLDMGVAGLVLLGAYFTHVWRTLQRLSTEPAVEVELRGLFRGAMAGLASLLVAGVADSSLAPRPEQAFLWFAIGVMYGVRRRLPPHPAAP